MNELTERLCLDQPVVVGGPDPSPEELRKRIEDIGHVFVKFTETRGGTDLGIRLDRDASDTSAADFEKGTGKVHVEGTIILNDDPVRCIADFDLATLKGTGHLKLVDKSELLPAD
jgi:core binding factor beta subunit